MDRHNVPVAGQVTACPPEDVGCRILAGRPLDHGNTVGFLVVWLDGHLSATSSDGLDNIEYISSIPICQRFCDLSPYINS
jgi:hypothetical protein